MYKALDYWSRDMLNFNFPEKGLGLVFLPLEYDFQEKYSFYNLLTEQISSSDCLHFSRY